MTLPFNSTRYIRNRYCEIGEAYRKDFQLHTVHQERDFLRRRMKNSICFQLHTVHQEPNCQVLSYTFDLSFNSTRYIRNPFRSCLAIQLKKLSTPHGTLGTHSSCKKLVCVYVLSTPHGTLGTRGQAGQNPCFYSFNSTRYIRNPRWKMQHPKPIVLSTPHGTLGTRHKRPVCEDFYVLSTPHGTLGTGSRSPRQGTALFFQLHTVHQEQTFMTTSSQWKPSFNSTRYIRNLKLPH